MEKRRKRNKREGRGREEDEEDREDEEERDGTAWAEDKRLVSVTVLHHAGCDKCCL